MSGQSQPSRSSTRLSTLWESATRPAASLQPSDIYPAKALASIALLFAPLMVIITFVILPLAISDLPNSIPTGQPMFYLGIGMIAVTLVTYALARTAHYQAGSVLFVSSLAVAVYAAAVLGDVDVAGRIEMLGWLATAVLLGSFFLNTRLTIILSAFSILGILIFPLFHPDNSLSTLVGVLSFVTITDAASVAIKIQRARLADENIHLLVKNQAALEQRVKERTSQLQAANLRLELLSRAREDFLNNISHEIRTPITAIILNHELIRNDPPKTATYLARLEREIGRLMHIVEPLLQMSRMDIFSPQLKMTGVDLNRLMRQLAEDRRDLADARHLSLTNDLDQDLPPAYADPRWIEQVASILLTNALNYTPPDGAVKLSTTKRVIGEVKWVGFCVTDTGPGVPQEEREQIFERFYRGKAARDSGIEGTGLGLAIARQIIEWHSGKMEVISSGVEGRGADFAVWLPQSGTEPYA